MYCLRTSKLTCLLVFFSFCEAAIKWDIKGKYVIYGQDATLTCNGKTCPSKAIKKWIGGPNYNLLCFDDYSTEPTKYKMMSNYTRPEFDLMIKGFNFSDANCEYTCSCGFLQYTNMLKLDDSNFIYLPVVKKNSSKKKDDTFQLDLVTTVFPLPTCKIFYEGSVFPVNVTVIKEPTETDLKLYTVNIQHTLNLSSSICKGNLSLTCQVGSLKHPILHQNIDFCEFEDEQRAKYTIILIISASGLLIFSVLSATIVFRRYRFVRERLSNSESRNLSETNQIELVPEVLPTNKADATPMLTLQSDVEEANPMLNEHEESNNARYEHSSIAPDTQIREDEKG